MLRITLVLFSLFMLTSCGRYDLPLPPEYFSPEAVRNLEVTALSSGVMFRWESSELDVRGEELENLGGYLVLRKELQNERDALDRGIEYEELKLVEDLSISTLRKQQQEAREQGLPARRLKVEPELTKFEFVDESLVPGGTYLYKIVPVNQGEVEGEVRQLVRVFFRGTTSDISFIESGEVFAENI